MPLHVEGEQPHEGVEGADEMIHPGARVAATAAAIDDGLGAFRPSTSFNDLTNLLPEPNAPAKDESVQTTDPPPAVAAAVPLANATTAGAPVVPNNAPPAPVASAPRAKVPAQGSKKRKAIATMAPAEPKKRIGPVTLAPLAKSGITLPASHVPAAIKAKPAPKVKAPKSSATVKVPTKSAGGVKVSQAPNNPAPARATSANKQGNAAVVPETASSAVKTTKVPAKTATEADFKNVAQAAVSSLILSTKNGEEPPSTKSDSVDEPVDTTTAHVKALTGANWVAACSGVGAAAVAANGAPVDAKGNGNRSKRQNLTADERARQNRDRNREHARNTRLRKKAYVEELKRTLTELVAQRDKAELQKTQAAQREVEQREVRFRVIEEFLKLRGSNESNYASWAAILDAKFSLTRPATEFRDIVQGDSVPDPTANIALEKTFTGVPDVMAESNEFASFLQTLGSSTEASEYNSVGFVYSCDRDHFFMDDNHAVLDWNANSMGLTMRYALSIILRRLSHFQSLPLGCLNDFIFFFFYCFS